MAQFYQACLGLDELRVFPSDVRGWMRNVVIDGPDLTLKTPERDGGFDRLAMRISRFDEVSSCYLASGGFDLLVLVEGKSMREIARFVAEKLSTLEGVLSTSTHFHLKTYKKNGCVFEAPVQTERLAVAP